MKTITFTNENNIYLNYLQTISENIMPNIMSNISLLHIESDSKKQDKYKNSIDKSLDPLVQALTHTYNFKVIPLELFYQLIKIKNHNINNINLLLEKTDIENYLNTNYADEIFKKADQNIKDNQELNKEFLNYFEYALLNKKTSKEKAFPYINKIITEHIKTSSEVKDISEELLQNCIIYLTEYYMENYVDNPICQVIDFKSNDNSDLNSEKDFLTFGVAQYHNKTIQINNLLVNSFYYTKNTAIFNTIFHELIHFDQETKLYKLQNISSIDDYTQLKDHILKEYIDVYYSENYYNISFEKDAEIKSYILTEKYFNSLGIVSENITEIKARLYQQIKKYSDTLRNINGHNEDLNSIFDDIVERTPDILERYPQLKIEWILDENGIIRKKSTIELKKDINIIKSDSNIKEKEQHTKLELINSFILEQEKNRGKKR